MVDYYCDFVNGTDDGAGTVHDGLKEGNYVAIAGTTNGKIHIDDAALDNLVDGDYVGDWFVNETLGVGGLIVDFVASDVGDSIITVEENPSNWNENPSNHFVEDTRPGDKFYILRSIKTIEKYTATLALPGYNLYIRANQIHNGFIQNITIVRDGTVDSRIKMIGCDSVTNDPWYDYSDVKPIIDFENQAYQLSMNASHNWSVERLVFKRCNNNGGTIYDNNTQNASYIDCEIRENFNTNQEGISFTSSRNFIVEGCIFEDCYGKTILGTSGQGVFRNCVLNGGSLKPSIYGISVSGGYYILENCSFGQDTVFTSGDISCGAGSVIDMRNCVYNTALVSGLIRSEDDQGVFGNHTMISETGSVVKDTTVIRSGGATSSALMVSDLNCGLTHSLNMGSWQYSRDAFKLWLDASEHTVTIYMRRYGTWATNPTTDQLYIEASYLNHVSNATRSTIASNDTLPESDTWGAFDVTFTPLQEGFVYLDVYLKKYQSASQGIYVDIKPVLS